MIETDFILVCCAACEGEGRQLEAAFDHQFGWYDRDTGPCPYCYGTGQEWVAAEPLTVADLDEIRALSEALREERDEAHEKLDRDREWR